MQVNTAVNDMDQVTQKNAAMVEEANAASATLAMESAKLRDLIAAFTLPGSSAKPSPARYSSFDTASPKRSARASRVGNAAVADDWQEF
jgi:methyl-accepting chemotaxis protein